jgi:hypothetical protein
MKYKQILYKWLNNHGAGRWILQKSMNWLFPGSAAYWEKRYAKQGNSGVGSYGENAAYKARIINQFVKEKEIFSVTDFGCGDGNQLKQFLFPEYNGFDVSQTAIKRCREIFKDDTSKQFWVYEPSQELNEKYKSQLVLSLDVVYHLVEDAVFKSYMKHVFSASLEYVIIYGWNGDGEKRYHVRPRKFSSFVEMNFPDFILEEVIEKPAGSPFCDFFIYRKKKLVCAG